MCGCMVEDLCDELDRMCTYKIELTPGAPVPMLNNPAGQWHTVKAMDLGILVLDCKNGPWGAVRT